MLRRWREFIRRAVWRARRRGWLWPGLTIFATLVAATLIVWLVDDVGRGDNIRRGAQVSGVEIGGLAPEEAAAALEPVRVDLAATVINLQFMDQTVTATAGELGIALDAEETIARANEASTPVVRPATWLFDLFNERSIDPALSTDRELLSGAVSSETDPESPRITLVAGRFEPVTSTEVPIPDMERLAEMLEEAVLASGGGTATVVVPITGMVPADPVAIELARQLADRANEITRGGVALQLEGSEETFEIPEEVIREFVILEDKGHDSHLTLEAGFSDTLNSLFAGIGRDGEPASFSLDEGGRVEISSGAPGFRCCDPIAPQAVIWAMSRGHDVVVVPNTEAPHPRGREWAESLGISEVVGEFTTNFRAGQQRVINIALIAELTQGAIIAPGEQFSVNNYVGRRTRAKGFVPGGMIEHGVFRNSVGGGVSQYATTLFNAAFFAGLDFISYQSHSIYLSRYPYGREATISYPAPNLVIENNTPYGVMLWPTTTSSSVTVRMYSTPWVVGEQTDQWTRMQGTSCTHVTTERTRTYLEDGRTETDTVSALYRPEGLKCDGTPSVTTTTSSTTSTTTTTTTTTTTPTTTTTQPPDTNTVETAGQDTESTDTAGQDTDSFDTPVSDPEL